MSDIETSSASPAGAIGFGAAVDVVGLMVTGAGSSIVIGSEDVHATVAQMASIPKVSRRST